MNIGMYSFQLAGSNENSPRCTPTCKDPNIFYFLCTLTIEPAMLLMERSLDRAPYLTAIMMEFLFFAIENYCPPLREYIQEHVAKAAQSITEKGVIRYERGHLAQCGYSLRK